CARFCSGIYCYGLYAFHFW
nr:immunoglobulin heavy chain junction region [Macaca mulatta]